MSTSRLVARTTSGEVLGREHHGVLQFAGVPYAAGAVGALRFRGPVPVESWSGVREATAFGPVSWQAKGAMAGLLGSPELHVDEDCLSLNVQTPAVDDGARPVMVWIHGGGFDSGSGSTPWYDGSSFVVRGDVVVVSLNYRLGALGFLHLGGPSGLGAEYASSGLSGVLDQVAALRWVRDNIAGFGGDPGNVTIFGESAGAMSVGTLLGLPAAQGLFHKAICQSGASSNVHTADAADGLTAAVVAQFGTADAEVLLTAEPQAILDAQVAVAAAAGRGVAGASAVVLPFQPVIDGVELPVAPLEAVRRGLSAHVPVIIGTTADEWNLFSIGGHPDEADLQRRAAHLVGDRADELVATYRADRPESSPTDLINAILTDVVFRLPALRLLEAQVGHQPDHTFQYLFSWRSRAFGGVLGSCHALEIPFVFNTLSRPGAEMFLGEPPDAPGVSDLALAMHDRWAAFARTGRPQLDGSHVERSKVDGSQIDVGGAPEWSTFDLDRRAVVEFGESVAVVDDPSGAERRFWDSRPAAPVSPVAG